MVLPKNQAYRFSEVPVTRFLLVAAVLLMPYDALRVMPSEYRPISLFPLVAALFFSIERLNVPFLSKSRIKLALFAGVSILTTGFMAISASYGTARIPNFILTILIGVALFYCFSILFLAELQNRGVKGFCDWLFAWISRAYVVPLLVGIVEACSLMGLLPAQVNSALAQFFGSSQGGRLTLTSYEASWASFHLLIASVSFYYRYKSSGNIFFGSGLAVSVLLFLYTQSMQGFMVLALGAVIYVFWLSYRRGNLMILLKWIAVIAACASLLLTALTLLYSANDVDTYYSRRLLGFVNFDSLIRSDGSAFIRIMFPVMGMQMFFDHPFIGIGGGMFAAYMPDYIYAYYPWAISFGEVASDIAGDIVPSAVCLYTRIIAEQGILGVFLFGSFFVGVLKGLGSVQDVDGWENRLLAFFFLLLVSMPLQFASYAFLPLWLALGGLDALRCYKRDCELD